MESHDDSIRKSDLTVPAQEQFLHESENAFLGVFLFILSLSVAPFEVDDNLCHILTTTKTILYHMRNVSTLCSPSLSNLTSRSSQRLGQNGARLYVLELATTNSCLLSYCWNVNLKVYKNWEKRHTNMKTILEE